MDSPSPATMQPPETLAKAVQKLCTSLAKVLAEPFKSLVDQDNPE
jgi:hypothetical protein